MKQNTNQFLNQFLENKVISKENYTELKYIAELTNFNINILNWFRYLQEIEITGWRNKYVTKKLCEILIKNNNIQFYSLFCPSYIKGEGEAGFRVDDVGNTTKEGLKTLNLITKKTIELGFNCLEPNAVFFDLSLEQPEKTIHMLSDLEKNINNFKKYVPSNMNFELLSEKFPELKDIIGYNGITCDPLPIDNTVLKRIVERGGKFYELFGWDYDKILARSKVIASSEAIVGTFLRNDNPDAIMIYTPTMLERAQVYSGRRQNEPLAIIMPKK